MKKKLLCNTNSHTYALLRSIRIMKLTTFLLLITFISVHAGIYSQTTRLNLNVRNSTVKDVLRNIEDQSEYFFMYNDKKVDVQRKVNLIVDQKKIEDVLNDLFEGTNTNYVIKDRQIVLYTDKEKELFDYSSLQQATKSVKGQVTDSGGKPLPGVTVVIKGTTTGTISDNNGNYALTNIPENAVLTFSFIGMQTQEITADKTVINISMHEETVGLEEVVAVGYGTQKKVTITGSVVSTEGENLARIPTSSVTNTLIGQLPGLIANNRNGEPGYDDAEILIRGKSTTGDNSPLIVVDGVADRAGGFARIDPNDIESISVLRDASAAIYGSRAANGVILVTTKRGNKGKTLVNYTMNFGIRRPTVLPKMSESWQYAQLLNEIETDIYGRDRMYSDDQIELFKSGEDPTNYPNVDALNKTLKDWSLQTQHNLSVSGGTEGVRYFISLGYQYNDNYYKNSASNYKQYNLRSNLDVQATKNLKLIFNLAARQQDRNSPFYGSEDIWRYLVKYDPRVNITWPGTDYPVIASQDLFNAKTAVNGDMGYQKDKTSYFNADLRFKWDLPFLIKGLSIDGGLYIDRSDNFYKNFQKAFLLYRKVNEDYDAVPYGPSNAILQQNMDQTLGITANFKINYEQTFKDLHNVSAFVAYEQYESRYDYMWARRQDYVSSEIDELFAGDETSKDNDGTASESGRINYFGRVDYNYAEKYLFQFNWRYDGSENFPKGKRFGFFPGFSAGWRISEEDFWKKSMRFIDYFKLKGSWGQMGNDRIDKYQYLTTYTFNNPAILGGSAPQAQTGVWQNRTANPNVTWEVATTYNAGFESRFLDHFSFDLDLFLTKRKDILATRDAAIPDYAGLTLPDENIGKAEAKGFEANLGYTGKAGEFKIHTTANISYAKSKITYIDEPDGTLAWQKITGKPIGADWLMYESIGIFRSQNDLDNYPHLANAEVGDLMFRDVDDDKTIDGNDYVRAKKTSTPEVIFGLSFNIDFRQWSLNMLWQGATNVWQYIFWESGSIGNFTKDFYNNRWTADNPNAPYPRVYDRQATVTGTPNTFWLEDATYLRLKNIQLAYELPKNLMNKLPFSNFRIYISAYNLLTFTGLKNTDPETTEGNQGFAAWSTPQSKVVNFGLNVSF